MGSSENRRKLWENRYNKGLCVYCGEAQFVVNKKGCKQCLKDKTEATKKFNKQKPERQKLYRRNLRKEVIDKYGGKCACCSEYNLLFLTIDHINNDGNHERQQLYGTGSGSSSIWYLKLKRELMRPDLQVLCFNCNLGKAMNNGTCPHVKVIPILNEDVEDLRNISKFGIREKIDWPNDNDLIAMCNKTCVEHVARELCVHGSAIRGRLKRRRKYNLVQKKSGAILPGSTNPSAKLNAQLVADIRKKYQSGTKRIDLAKEYNVSKSTIDKVITNKYWKA